MADLQYSEPGFHRQIHGNSAGAITLWRILRNMLQHTILRNNRQFLITWSKKRQQKWWKYFHSLLLSLLFVERTSLACDRFGLALEHEHKMKKLLIRVLYETMSILMCIIQFDIYIHLTKWSVEESDTFRHCRYSLSGTPEAPPSQEAAGLLSQWWPACVVGTGRGRGHTGGSCCRTSSTQHGCLTRHHHPPYMN